MLYMNAIGQYGDMNEVPGGSRGVFLFDAANFVTNVGWTVGNESALIPSLDCTCLITINVYVPPQNQTAVFTIDVCDFLSASYPTVVQTVQEGQEYNIPLTCMAFISSNGLKGLICDLASSSSTPPVGVTVNISIISIKF
jgi:hypothetical protein